jgi:hypothetical protein
MVTAGSERTTPSSAAQKALVPAFHTLWTSFVLTRGDNGICFNALTRFRFARSQNPPPGIFIHIAPESVSTCPGIRTKGDLL